LSLDKSLFREDKSIPILEWRPRFNIAIQTARGLAYLHDDIRDQRIIHRDVKPENILLDSTYSAKVADFGLSRILNRKQSLTMTTHVQGTYGYLAPEWTSNFTPITSKTDVYSFGMVLFEIISGRRNAKPPAPSSNELHDSDNWYFPLWAYSKLNESNFDILEVLDPSLTGMADPTEVERVLKVAFWCINNNHQLRPSMSKVVQMLEGHVPIGLPIPQPTFNDKFFSASNGFPSLAKKIPD
jgi:serine/threonine protein kinase